MTKKPLTPEDLVIGSFTPLTTIDYPGELSAVIFLQGCPWRCRYCQNADLLPRRSHQRIDWSTIIQRLQRRRGLLDAVVFSGGEPTLQPALIPAIEEVRALGFKIGLHSAGIYPQRLQKILPLIDWIGLDIKAAKSLYPAITDVSESGQRAWRSAQLVIDSGVDHEIRTTVHAALLDDAQWLQTCRELQTIGAQRVVIQPCRAGRCLDPQLEMASSPLSPHLMESIQHEFTHFSFR